MRQGRDVIVDPDRHANEIARFFAHVVRGPGRQDCWLWTGAIGSDGYGRFALRRNGWRQVVMVRPPRYALAVAQAGQPLQGDVRALHECDVTLCVRVVTAEEIGAGVRPHVMAGTQQENMEQMATRGRGGGRPSVIARGAGLRARRERALALREAVQSGWDSAAVEAAMLGEQPRLW
ncbi:hypothetical protein BHQ17_04645 [Mycolicibacterium holsaticum]|uniref:Uncharacterized protein n=1 Tax=Mycolicibacterium holsaticum TaxID=152142 RepID=A0A1E3S056_9MYCO|nr:hypothetical protein [Mycolicibacterium holsaticum]ODQ95573.1 hypothetical protein BHQ17_04645 [Mycolicibacterium holsaticum]